MLEVYTLNENIKWDEIVKTFKDYDVYYLSGYTKAFYLHNDGIPLMFFYHDECIRAINVVMKRDISKDEHFVNKLKENEYFDLTTPYGYGGWIVEGEGPLDLLINEYSNWCKQNNIISEIVRFHPVIGNQEKLRNVYDIMDLGKTISIDTTKEDEIWNNFDGKNRNVIRKSMKNGVVIRNGITDDIIKEFKNIYNQTMDRDCADKYYYFDDEFYNSIKNDLKDNCDIYYAVYENQIIAASIILKCNGKLSYHLSGSIRQFSSLAATNYILSEVSLWGARNGYKSFHLGGGVGSHEDSLYKFKKSFYKRDGKQYSIGKMIFDKEAYDKLVELRKNSDLRENYFPLYRA